MLTRETAKGWSDGLIKVVTGVGGLLAILIVLNNVFGWSIGGLVTGNQAIQTEQKHNMEAMAKDIAEIRKSVEPLPRTMQVIDDHTKLIGDLRSEHDQLRSQLTQDERTYDASLAELRARINISSTPVRQPRQ